MKRLFIPLIAALALTISIRAGDRSINQPHMDLKLFDPTTALKLDEAYQQYQEISDQITPAMPENEAAKLQTLLASVQQRIDALEQQQYFSVAFAWPSVSKRKQLNQVDEKHVAETAAIVDQYPDVHQSRQLPLDERKRLFNSDTELAKKSTLYDTAITEVNDRAVLRVCQIALVPTGLTAHQRELLGTDVDGEFWRSQPWGVMMEINNRFRISNSTGRSADQVDSKLANPQPAATPQPPGDTAGSTEPADVAAPATA
jgi:hypothetical protein